MTDDDKKHCEAIDELVERTLSSAYEEALTRNISPQKFTLSLLTSIIGTLHMNMGLVATVKAVELALNFVLDSDDKDNHKIARISQQRQQ